MCFPIIHILRLRLLSASASIVDRARDRASESTVIATKTEHHSRFQGKVSERPLGLKQIGTAQVLTSVGFWNASSELAPPRAAFERGNRAMRGVASGARRLLLSKAIEVDFSVRRNATRDSQRKMSRTAVEEDQEKRNAVIRKRTLDLREINVGPLPKDSPYMKPMRMHYVQNGRPRNWDLMLVHDAVSLVVFNTTRKKLVFVRQFRPAVYYACLPKGLKDIDVERYPASLGLTLELCAGIVDKDQPLVEIAREELLEECGYDAPASAFTEILANRSNVGTSGGKGTTYYVEVTDEMRVTPGGGVEADGELIEVVDMSIPEVKEYIAGPFVESPPGFLLGVYWFLHNKAGLYS